MFFAKRKEQIEQAENAVWDYIHICREADEALSKCTQFDIENGTHIFMFAPYKKQIDEKFKEMKSLVDKCPRKFRNQMALRLVVSGVAN